MMASRGLRISGSGTVSMRTSCFPCQASARIESILLFIKLGARPGGGGNLPRLHQLLETAEIAARLNCGFALKHLGDQLSDHARGRIIKQRGGYDRAARTRVAEIDPAAVGHVSTIL